MINLIDKSPKGYVYLRIHTPLKYSFPKFSTGGVWILNGEAQSMYLMLLFSYNHGNKRWLNLSDFEEGVSLLPNAILIWVMLEGTSPVFSNIDGGGVVIGLGGEGYDGVGHNLPPLIWYSATSGISFMITGTNTIGLVKWSPTIFSTIVVILLCGT